jgi:hypothetical protein
MSKLSTVSVGTLLALLASAGAQALTVPSFTPSPGQPAVGNTGYPDFWSADYSASLSKTNSSTYTLSIMGSNMNLDQKNGVSTLFNFQNASYQVVPGTETLNITANFSTTGVFQSGSLEIDGALNPWNNPTLGTPPAGFQNAKAPYNTSSTTWQNNAVPTQKLFSATLTNVAVDSADEGLGFSINNFGGWADQKAFTNNGVESLWLYAICSNQPVCGYSGKQAQTFANSLGWADSTGNSAWNTFLAEIKGHSTLVANQFYDIASIATVPLPAAGLLLFSGLGLGGMVARRRRRAEPAAA